MVAVMLASAAAALSVALFPLLFNFVSEDDSYVLISLRNFLGHGDLYGNTSSQYGPFYYLFMSPLYRVSGLEPTLDNSRVLVLVMTALSAAMFGGAVWRVARSLPWALFAELTTFLILAQRAGEAPMHPGALIALLLAALTLALASRATTGSGLSLFVAGLAVGALLMVKVNVGLFAIGGLLVAFAVGNRRLGRWIQCLAVAAVATGPFLLVRHDLIDPPPVLFTGGDSDAWLSLAAVTTFAIVALAASLSADPTEQSLHSVVLVGTGMSVVVVASVGFVLLTGSTFGNVVRGIVLAPAHHNDIINVPPPGTLHWVPIVITVAGLAVLLPRLRERPPSERLSVAFSWPHLALTVLALGLVGTATGGFEPFASWLPTLALLPALASLATASEPTRLALRFLLPVAILQVLHVYPAAGYQTAWATVAVIVPLAIAGAAGTAGVAMWTRARRSVQVIAVVLIAVLITVTMDLWPGDRWSTYLDNPSLDLPGARLVRLDPTLFLNSRRDELRQVTHALRQHCDAFYSTPGAGYFYVFSGIPPLAAPFAPGWWGILDERSQRRVVTALEKSARRGQRVCSLVRADVRFSKNALRVQQLAPGVGQRDAQRDDPLVTYLSRFTETVQDIGQWSLRVIPGSRGSAGPS